MALEQEELGSPSCLGGAVGQLISGRAPPWFDACLCCDLSWHPALRKAGWLTEQTTAAAAETPGWHHPETNAAFTLLLDSSEILQAALQRQGFLASVSDFDTKPTLAGSACVPAARLPLWTIWLCRSRRPGQALGMDSLVSAGLRLRCICWPGLAAGSRPSAQSRPPLAHVQGQQATTLPAPFRAASGFCPWTEILFAVYIASMLAIRSSAGKLCFVA